MANKSTSQYIHGLGNVLIVEQFKKDGVLYGYVYTQHGTWIARYSYENSEWIAHKFIKDRSREQ
jgi:hypothetical protein